MKRTLIILLAFGLPLATTVPARADYGKNHNHPDTNDVITRDAAKFGIRILDRIIDSKYGHRHVNVCRDCAGHVKFCKHRRHDRKHVFQNCDCGKRCDNPRRHSHRRGHDRRPFRRICRN